jgi:hypothetical protein
MKIGPPSPMPSAAERHSPPAVAGVATRSGAAPSSDLTQQAVSSPRRSVPNERLRRRPPPGRRTGTAGEWPPATGRSRQLPQKMDPNAGRLLGVVFETIVPVGAVEPDREHGVTGERQPDARRTTLCPGVWPPVRQATTAAATSHSSSNGRRL